MSITQGTPASTITTTTWNGSTFIGTLSVTVPSGASVLTVLIAGAANRMPPTAVKYNGTAMTQRSAAVSGNQRGVAIYDIDSPTAGTFNVTTENGAATQYTIYAVALSGVDSGTPRRTAVDLTGFATNATLNYTTVAGDFVIGMLCTEGQAITTTGGTERYNAAGPIGGGSDFTAVASATATGTTTTLSWTHGGAWRAAEAIAYIEASGGGPTPAPSFGRYGVRGPVR
jgi:hypothetical protein